MSRSPTATRTVHSERAQWAWARVSETKGLGGETSKEYATHVRKLPARIQVCGLGQALAFLFAKNKSDRRETGAGRLLVHLGARIAPHIKKEPRDLSDPSRIMDAIVNMDPDQYRRCTHELLLTTEWLKRFVDGLFEKDDE